MIFNIRYITLAAITSTLVHALPLDPSKPRGLVPRAKSYSVINVDGGSSTEAPAGATTIIEQTTKTVEVTAPGPTVYPVPAPVTASSSCSTNRSSSSIPTPTSNSTITMSASCVSSTSTSIETPKPVFVTVTIITDDGPTEYYDSGMWHTSYRIKSFEAVATASPLSTLSNNTSTSTV